MPRNSHIEPRMFRAFHHPTRTSEKTNFDSLAAHNHSASIILRLPPHCGRCSCTAVQHGIRVSTWYDVIAVLPKWTDCHVLPARDIATARDITDAGPSPNLLPTFLLSLRRPPLFNILCLYEPKSPPCSPSPPSLSSSPSSPSSRLSPPPPHYSPAPACVQTSPKPWPERAFHPSNPPPKNSPSNRSQKTHPQPRQQIQFRHGHQHANLVRPQKRDLPHRLNGVLAPGRHTHLSPGRSHARPDRTFSERSRRAHPHGRVLLSETAMGGRDGGDACVECE